MESLKLLKKRLVLNLAVLSIFGLSVIGLSIYFLFGKGAYDLVIEQTLHREQVVVRAGTVSFSSIFDITGNSLVFLAQSPRIRGFNESTTEALDEFMDSWKDSFIEGIVLTDEEGIIKFFSNTQNIGSVGVSIADRDYFKWAKDSKPGKYQIFSPVLSRLGITKGKYIVPVAAPIYSKDGTFKGVLVSPILVSKITEYFLDPIKISESTRIYIVDKEGVLIFSPYENLLGKNYISLIEESNFLGSKKTAEILKERTQSNEEGKLDIQLPNAKTANLERFLIAHSPIEIGNNHWTLIAATPVKEALAFMMPFYIKGVIMLGILVIVFLVIAIRISKVVGFIEASESEHKHHKLPIHSEPPDRQKV